jgi:hypothetical protein
MMHYFWKPGQVYLATFVAFLLGVFFAVVVTTAVEKPPYDRMKKQVQQDQVDKGLLLGRVVQLEGELGDARRAADAR